jgi:LuxR family transcriptional regulator, maltose regulon positive regulatory protein
MRIPSTDAHRAAQSRGRGETHDPIPTSKVTQPDRPGLGRHAPAHREAHRRERARPLTSVTGPPGAGKTMATAAWATSTGYPCALAWLSIDDYDGAGRTGPARGAGPR